MFFLIAFPARASMPVSREQLFQIGMLAARDGKYEEAEGVFKKILELDPRFAPAYNSLGLLSQTINGETSAEALRYFKTAVDLDPRYTECWNNLGRAYYLGGQYALAEKALVQSLELMPDQPGIQSILGWVYLFGESRAEEAVTWFERALASHEDNSLQYGLGLCYLILGEKFKVLDKITELRRRGQEDQAARLEKMIREGIKISSKPGSPLVTGAEAVASVFDQELEKMAGRPLTISEKTGAIQIRLKGPLKEQ